jgi:hypothetical protein
MKNQIQNYNQIVSDLKKDYQKLTEFELLSLAIQIERNQILENGFVVSSDDINPSGLEAIAIALGFENSDYKSLKIQTETNNDEPSTFCLSIDKLPLTYSVKAILKEQKIFTVGDLVCYTKEGIRKIKYMKGKGSEDVEQVLSDMGLSLGMKKHY